MEENKKGQFWEEHPRAVFWIRFVLWSVCAAIFPFLFIAFRFDIFKSANSLSLSGWGIIGVIIVAIFVFLLIWYLKKGFGAKSVFVSQILNGFTRIIVPLTVLYAIVYISSKNLEAFSQSLGCVILCELIAIPLNPMPKWVEECKKDGIISGDKDVIDYIVEKIFKKKEDE